jgi:hypothetical protein
MVPLLFHAARIVAFAASPILLKLRLHTTRTTKMLAPIHIIYTTKRSSIYLPQVRQRPVGLQGVRNGSSTIGTNIVVVKTTHKKNNKNVSTNSHNTHHKTQQHLLTSKASAFYWSSGRPQWQQHQHHQYCFPEDYTQQEQHKC